MSKIKIAQSIFWYSISNRAGDLSIQVIDNGLEKYHIFFYIFSIIDICYMVHFPSHVYTDILQTQKSRRKYNIKTHTLN